MKPHVCPWWGGYFIDNPLRRLLHNPDRILAPYLRPGMVVLDFGCGMGLFAIAAARLVGAAGRVVAVDLQQEMLDVMMKRSAKAGVADRVTPHRCRADALGLSEPIDSALAFYCVHEVPDQRRLLREIHALLRPGGKFLVAEPIVHVRKADFQSMLTLAQQEGFQTHNRPRIRLSHSAVLTKPSGETAQIKANGTGSGGSETAQF